MRVRYRERGGGGYGERMGDKGGGRVRGVVR